MRRSQLGCQRVPISILSFKNCPWKTLQDSHSGQGLLNLPRSNLQLPLWKLWLCLWLLVLNLVVNLLIGQHKTNKTTSHGQYLNDWRADILFLSDDGLVGRAVGKLGRVIVDIFNLDHDDTSTAATCSSAAATAIVGRRDVKTIRHMCLVQWTIQRDDAWLRINAEWTFHQRTNSACACSIRSIHSPLAQTPFSNQ